MSKSSGTFQGRTLAALHRYAGVAQGIARFGVHVTKRDVDKAKAQPGVNNSLYGGWLGRWRW